MEASFPKPSFFYPQAKCYSSFPRLEWKMIAQPSPWKSRPQCPARENWHDPPVNGMGFTHITDALVPAHIQHEIREPDCISTGWIAHAAEVEPARGQRHCVRKRQTQGTWGSVLVSSQPSEIVKTAIFQGNYLLEIQLHPHSSYSWWRQQAAAKLLSKEVSKLLPKEVNECLEKHKPTQEATRGKVTNPPFFLVFRTMSLLHWGHFRTETGVAGYTSSCSGISAASPKY